MKFFFSKDKKIQTVPATEIPKISDISTSFLIETIASLLMNSVITHHAESYREDEYTGKSKPPITIEHYLLRFCTYLINEPSIYILLVIYLNKYLEKVPDASLNEMNVHRLTACSLLLAYKQLMDLRFDNLFVSRVAGVSLSELNLLEINFLKILDFETHVPIKDFEKCYQRLYEHALYVKLEQSNSVSPSA
ncbi:cyclin family putative virulence effector [Legionella quateirensis]|uniref:Cyclin n=1 Tax=Legionella quateirensis TaxID=45072 RepID=A0A378KSQ9_9GAMM|nr:cyclin family putative virulence effector [Legionella quateirensis]KTD52999.1 Cyclin [Legionella quateirensis]STY17219.1 Cyclin [Legionella quateirensis]